jgi:murein hydrolase activator
LQHYFKGRRAMAALLCAALALAAAGVQAAKVTERSKQKTAAETARAGLQQKLTALKKEISRTESAKDDAADTLSESEEAISTANRKLRDLAGEQTETAVKLRDLANSEQQLSQTAAHKKKQLAALLRAHYVAGNEDRIKLLLSGDNPNRINRDLKMMAYVSQAQARLLVSLRANLQAVESTKQQTQNGKDELEEMAQEEREQKTVLEQEKGHRAAALAALKLRLVDQRKQAGKIERDEQRMAGLVDKLSQLIREQAAAAAVEKRRLEQVALAKAKANAQARAAQQQAQLLAQARAQARAQAERARLAREAARAARPGVRLPPEPVRPVPEEEPVLVQRKPDPKPEPEPEPEPAKAADVGLAPAAPDGAFASLRGQLRAPVSGKVGARFGSKRGDGPSWKGVFIRAAEGLDIKSVAAGRVVFAQWLRGFGNLIIVDHGGQYLSIYGNNQTLLKRAGDAVRGGDAIASVGNTGGNEESGLYFELRHQGRAFDPASWVKF